MTHSTVAIDSSRLKSRRGAMLAFVAISMVGLLGLVAIATDIGAGNRQRRIAQTAADAGAIGGGRQIQRHLDSASVVAFALNSAARNGFPAAEVTVFYPPATGNHIGDKNYVEVLIVKSIPTVFGRIFNKNTLDIQARAVAGLGSATNYCVYSLASSGKGIDWSGQMTTNCGVVGNADIDLKHEINKTANGFPTPDVSAAGTIDPDVAGHTFENVPPVPDPYSHLAPPADTTCDFFNTVISTDQTLSEGVYCGGITVNNNIKATLNPGTYFVRGGGITGGQIEGLGGVTIINSNGPGNNQLEYRPFVFGNNCQFHITAPSSGPYKGIAVFQDPAAPAAANATEQVNDFCGKGTNAPCDPTDVDITGVVYLPTQTIRVGISNGKLTIAGTLLAKYMTSTSGAEGCFFLDTSGNSAPLRLSLVE